LLLSTKENRKTQKGDDLMSEPEVSLQEIQVRFQHNLETRNYGERCMAIDLAKIRTILEETYAAGLKKVVSLLDKRRGEAVSEVRSILEKVATAYANNRVFVVVVTGIDDWPCFSTCAVRGGRSLSQLMIINWAVEVEQSSGEIHQVLQYLQRASGKDSPEALVALEGFAKMIGEQTGVGFSVKKMFSQADVD